ncbi:O-antigen ligase family protein [Congregibacter litoralis]|uniref:Lipid A core-O-antigen ligase n=1 Tax=Congregibacter litoralis KT71 TaxID=314285 RepID=A4ACC3_9GAMM|nr:O-antigen ligase family protein [Congregibacter litoralis]EAQ96351.2 Lipid A core - O-antigen ligase [Congregibacter litoralis KT71]
MSWLRFPFPALLLVLAVVLLPFGRMIEIPMGLLAIAGLLMVLRAKGLCGASHGNLLLALIAAFAVPMLISLPDAIALKKASLTTLGTLRYAMSCAALLCWFQCYSEEPLERDGLLRALGLAVALLLTLWCVDGLWQFATGSNVLGYGVGEGYINGLFGDDDNIKFGVALAFLLPVGLVYGLRHWPPVVVGGFLLLVLILIVLSGKRAAWISVSVELAALGIYYFFRGRLGLLKVVAVLAVGIAALTFAYQSSDWVRERSVVIVSALDEPSYTAVNKATGLRLPIWRTALAMGEAHWINGVGPRGFRYAYRDFAVEGDRWARPAGEAGGAKASHAHQLLLELWAETGVVGLMGYGIFLFLLGSAWQRGDAHARSRALPYGVALVGVLFPLNTHLAWYSSWHALLLWLFIGVFLLALSEKRSPENDQAIAELHS